MPPPRDSPYQLWVEGSDDRYTLIQLLVRHGYDWDAAAAQRPHIRVAGSVEQLLRSVPTAVKTSHTRRLGWVLDANGDAAGQWQRLRDRLLTAEVEAPAELPAGRGVFPVRGRDVHLGVWLMPGGGNPGSLEEFVLQLVPEGDVLWDHSAQVVAEARTVEARVPENKILKSRLHSWLAWQKEPGMPFGLALQARILDAQAPLARQFVAWFHELFPEA